MPSEPGPRNITIAIMALGGQGGGVMADWTVRAGELAGYRAQYTSVQGVAQRTGATVYYIELFPEAEIAKRGKDPVMALMPAPGDVDVIVASELMEAGRAVMRGFVTPDRTTLIGSTHRVYAISEKVVMGDGRADSNAVQEAALSQAKTWIGFDMDQTAREGGSVISAVMFGALAGSGALPIPRSVFEDVIRESGKAVEANLRTFALGFDRARGERLAAAPVSVTAAVPAPKSAAIRDMLAQIEADVPFIAQSTAIEGLRRVVDYQDEAYGQLYLNRLASIAAVDRTAGGTTHNHELVRVAAKYIALWMSFDDTFRVADLKTRGSRFARVHREVKAAPGQIVAFTEFMHPRLEEVADSLPAWLGKSVAGWTWLEPLFARGRKVRTSSLRGYLMLSAVASGRRWRRSTLRFKREDAAIESWLATVRQCAASDYAAAVELVHCQKLVRGYSDTHARGAASLALILADYESKRGAPKLAERIRMLREAASKDEEGTALATALTG